VYYKEIALMKNNCPTNEVFTSVNLFFKEGMKPSSSKISKILGHLTLENKSMIEDNLSFDLNGRTYDEVRDILRSMLDLLDDRRRSQATIFEDGAIRCITINNKQLLG
jgi:hypothetical protein